MRTTEREQRAASPARWIIDGEESSVDFAVETFWGLKTVRGHFDRFAGSYESGPDGTTIKLKIDADSLDTGHRTRDAHLRSDDFFGVSEHPQVRFSSTRVRPAGDGILHVEGGLEAAGTVVPLEFDATVEPVDGGLEIEATTTVDQRRFGMRSGLLAMIRRPATLHVKARLSEAVRGETWT